MALRPAILFSPNIFGSIPRDSTASRGVTPSFSFFRSFSLNSAEKKTGDGLTFCTYGLARSTKQLCEIIERVKIKRLRLSIVGSINVDCSNGELDPMTNAFIQMSGVFAELELRIIRERVRSGMQNAKAKGAKIGRPQTQIEDIPQAFLRHYPAFKSGQLNMSEFARVCNLSRTTAYKYVALLEQ